MKKILNLVDYFLPFVIGFMLASYFLSNSYTVRYTSGETNGAITTKRMYEDYSIGDTIVVDNHKAVVIKID